jgi:hypothetical protein
MPLDFSCFVSFASAQEKVLEPLVSDLVRGLKQEIYVLTRKEVWIDSERLEGGQRFNERLATDLCKSVCMVVLYTPLYFDIEHTYCAREYRAMEILEERRFTSFNGKLDKSNGLILPIIVRGEKTFPRAIRDERQCYFFDDILLADPEVKLRSRYADQIRQMSEYIFERCNSFDGLPEDVCADCDEFVLPSDVEAREYLVKLLGKSIPRNTARFPGR